MASVILFLLVFGLLPAPAASFGEAIDDKVTDIRFRNMGQAYISVFEIVDTVATFQVILEDTLNEAEYWVVDFQKFGAFEKTAVDPSTGNIHPENTGECSNVIFDAPYKQENVAPGYYFSDVGNFVSRNVSLLGGQINGNGNAVHKRLFTSYVRGSSFTEPDSDGNDIQRRDYILSFDEDFAYFFNCTDTEGNNIWRFADTTDTIEFRTTIYFTNVRPVDPTDGTKGMSWVSSSVDLIYRLSRVAIVNFIVSSTALVKPVLDFVIIDPYFPTETPTIPDGNKASIEFQFQTTVESPNGELLALYNATSLLYIPKNTSSASYINMDLGYEFPDGPQQCQYVSTARCRQIWNFHFVLDLDVEIVDSDLPVDATGTFKFRFSKYRCNDPTENNPVDCTDLDLDPLTISLEVTIQTVVQILDGTNDHPTIQLVSLTGENGEDLRAGGGRRGVNHLEPVSIIVQFIPEVLRSDFDLELTLFMVCRSDWSGAKGGCLETSQSQRYVAYANTNFNYVIDSKTETNEIGEPEPIYLDFDDLQDDNTVQNLTSNFYDSVNNVYNMGFINSALSQQRLTYTITVVFSLVLKPGRRRRAIAAPSPKLLTTHLGGAGEMIQGLVPYGSSRPRTRRDLMDAVAKPQGHAVALMFNGCPENSTFNSAKYHCACDQPQEKYSTETYTCLRPNSLTPDIKVVDINDIKAPDSGVAPSCITSHSLSIVLFMFLTAQLN